MPGLLAAQSDRVLALFPEKPAGYLTDVAGVVDQASATEIASWAEKLRSATGAELAVVTLPTVGEVEASEVALAIGRRWGVGAQGEAGDSAKNAGVVLLLVPQQNHQAGTGRVRIETGRGVEGIITDAIAGRITDLMVPALRQEQYGPALALGARAIAATVAKGFGVSDSALAAADPFQGGGGGEDFNPLVGLLIAVVILIIIASIAKGSGGGGGGGSGRRYRAPPIIFGGGGGWGGGGGGFGGGGFGGFGGGGGFSGGGAGRSF